MLTSSLSTLEEVIQRHTLQFASDDPRVDAQGKAAGKGCLCLMLAKETH